MSEESSAPQDRHNPTRTPPRKRGAFPTPQAQRDAAVPFVPDVDSDIDSDLDADSAAKSPVKPPDSAPGAQSNSTSASK